MTSTLIAPVTAPVVPRGAVPAHPVADTPYLALDVEVAAARYARLAAAFPGTRIHYAVKANPHPALLARLAAAGARFDVASPAEVDACVAAGADAHQLLYTNPIKLRRDLTTAHLAGVRTFVVDSVPELLKVAQQCPGADVLCRLLTSGVGSDWPLSRKYGATEAECVDILTRAAELGLGPAGVAFHVGSQQREPGRWRAPIRQAARVFAELRLRGIEPWLLDLGGGLPAELVGHQPSPEAYALVIEHELTESFGARRPQTVIEPGRGIAGDAGVLVSSVVAVCWRGGRRWVYLDAGVFTGLVETVGEAIRYRVDAARYGRALAGPTGRVVLAGPTCDSMDVLYEHALVELPLDLAEGDLVLLRAAGAYTSTYSTVGFNGFAPLPTRLVSAG